MANGSWKGPVPIRFQERDGRIIETIHAFDGVMARRHIHALFWPTARHTQAMERRLSLLRRSGYIDWPDAKQRRTKPIPEPIVWLGWRGALYIAGKSGLPIEAPRKINETRLRGLQQALREGGIRWLREPRWIQLEHDLGVSDVRLAIAHAAEQIPRLTLETWIPEGAYLSKMDFVTLRQRDSEGRVKTVRRGVRPDGFFVIADDSRKKAGVPSRSRHLLELDLSTHPIRRFTERAKLYLAYIFSPAYRKRHQYNSGRWLVITRSTARRDHLIKHTETALGAKAGFFWFSTLDEVLNRNPLTDRIWLRGDWTYPGMLFVGHQSGVVYDSKQEIDNVSRRQSDVS